MAIMTISKAISAGIQRNVAVSTIKHEERLDVLKRELAVERLKRTAHYGRKLTEARIEQAAWEATLTPTQAECYIASLADIEAIIAPVTTKD